MKHKLKKLLVLTFAIMLVLTFPINTYAAEAGGESTSETGAVNGNSDGSTPNGNLGSDSQTYVDAPPDAINEILQNSRFNGAVEQISWLTSWFDQFSVQIVSVCAFLIIAAAFLKNAMAGAYCANSKFWDKVDDAHKKKDALSLSMIKGYFTGGGYNNTTVAGFKDGLLSLVPNVKSFTDFDDADIQPKQYFMRSIPQMCMCVIIGIFIYNGYYRDTAAVVGDFGAEAFRRVMAAASPSELLDNLSQSTGMPALLTDGRTDANGKLLNQIADSARKAIITEFKLKSSNSKIVCSAAVENWVIQNVQDKVAPYMEDTQDNSWKVTAKVKLVAAAGPETAAAAGTDVTSADGTTRTIVVMTENPVVGMEGFVPDGSEQAKAEKQNLYLRVTLTATKTEWKGGKNAGITVTETNNIPSANTGWGSDVTITVNLSASDAGNTKSIASSYEQGTLICLSETTGVGPAGAPSIRAVHGGGIEVSVPSNFTGKDNNGNSYRYPYSSDLLYIRGEDGVKHHIYVIYNVS